MFQFSNQESFINFSTGIKFRGAFTQNFKISYGRCRYATNFVIYQMILTVLFCTLERFKCSLALVTKCLDDIPMYVKFVSHEQVY